MKVFFIGTNPEAVAKVELAVRLRWPDGEFLISSDPDNGLEVLDQQCPDVVFFQAEPRKQSVDVFIHRLRAFSEVPLIVLEGEGGTGYMEEVKALESGADDYIKLSAGIIDIVARLVALIRRVRRLELSEDNRPISSGSLTLIPATYQVFLSGDPLTLTSTEFRLLHLLIESQGNVVTHDFIGRTLWGDQVNSSPLVKKYVHRLRRKLGSDPKRAEWITNVHGVGYRIADPSAEEEAPVAVAVA